MSETSRKLAAIMFTDIVGFTEQMGKDEEVALDLLQMNRALLKPIINSFRGEWLKEMGDGTFSCFNSAVDAVKCALEIQKILENNNDLTIRVGIHIGDVVQQDGDVFGDGVNIAARLEPLAAPGGICISEKVHDDIRNKPNIHSKFIGEKNLKGVDRPLKIYALLTDPIPEPQKAIPVQNKQSSASKNLIFAVLGLIVISLALYVIKNSNLMMNTQISGKSVAVLPFDNYSTAPEDQFFSDGVTEVIIANLAKIKDLKVISRTSVMQYKNTEKTIDKIGRELGVAHILEGSIQRAGNQVRIVGQLINAKTDEHIWAETYDGSITNFFEFQSDIAIKIANALHTSISEKEDELIRTIPTKNMEAWDTYLTGLNYFRKSNLRADYISAKTYFDAAYQIDTLFVEAISKSANCDLLLFWMGYESKDKMVNSAKEKIEKAKAINPQSPQLLDAEGTYYYYGLRDYFTALDFYRKASELEPGNGDIISNIGYIQRRMGNFDQSIITHEKALVHNPNDPGFRIQMMFTYDYVRNYSKAIEFCDKVISLNPSDIDGQILKVEEKGKLTLDINEMQKGMEKIKKNFLIEEHEHHYYIFNTNTLSRQYETALKDINAIGSQILKIQAYYWPINYMKAEINELMGNRDKSKKLFNESLNELKEYYQQFPSDERIISQLALNYAVLNDSINAIKLINSARNILPIEKDPLNGPIYLVKEAEVYLILGEIDKCLDLIELSSKIPAGVHALNLLQPKYDKIREHPRFIKVFNRLPPNNENNS